MKRILKALRQRFSPAYREQQIEVMVKRLYDKELLEIAQEALRLLDEDTSEAEAVWLRLQDELAELKRKVELAGIGYAVSAFDFDTVADFVKSKIEK